MFHRSAGASNILATCTREKVVSFSFFLITEYTSKLNAFQYKETQDVNSSHDHSFLWDDPDQDGSVIQD